MVWVISFCSLVAELNRLLGTQKLSRVDRSAQTIQVHVKSPCINLHTPPNPTCSRWYDHEWSKADYKPDSPPLTSIPISLWLYKLVQSNSYIFCGGKSLSVHRLGQLHNSIFSLHLYFAGYLHVVYSITVYPRAALSWTHSIKFIFLSQLFFYFCWEYRFYLYVAWTYNLYTFVLYATRLSPVYFAPWPFPDFRDHRVTNSIAGTDVACLGVVINVVAKIVKSPPPYFSLWCSHTKYKLIKESSTGGLNGKLLGDKLHFFCCSRDVFEFFITVIYCWQEYTKANIWPWIRIIKPRRALFNHAHALHGRVS